MDIRTVITWADGTVSADNATERAARLAAERRLPLTLLVPRRPRLVRHPQHWDDRCRQLERRYAIVVSLRLARSLARWLATTAPRDGALVVCDEPAARSLHDGTWPLLVVRWHHAMRHDRVLVAAASALPRGTWAAMASLMRGDAAVDLLSLAGTGQPVSLEGAPPAWRARGAHAIDCRRNRRLGTADEMGQVANQQDFAAASLVVVRPRVTGWLQRLLRTATPATWTRRLQGDLLLVPAR